MELKRCVLGKHFNFALLTFAPAGMNKWGGCIVKAVGGGRRGEERTGEWEPRDR